MRENVLRSLILDSGNKFSFEDLLFSKWTWAWKRDPGGKISVKSNGGQSKREKDIFRCLEALVKARC